MTVRRRRRKRKNPQSGLASFALAAAGVIIVLYIGRQLR
jgi:hypothetical protein